VGLPIWCLLLFQVFVDSGIVVIALVGACAGNDWEFLALLERELEFYCRKVINISDCRFWDKGICCLAGLLCCLYVQTFLLW